MTLCCSSFWSHLQLKCLWIEKQIISFSFYIQMESDEHSPCDQSLHVHENEGKQSRDNPRQHNQGTHLDSASQGVDPPTPLTGICWLETFWYIQFLQQRNMWQWMHSLHCHVTGMKCYSKTDPQERLFPTYSVCWETEQKEKLQWS